MAVESVSGPKFFTSQAYTNQGNEYRKSNYGKIAGTAVGVGVGACTAVKLSKACKALMPLFEESGARAVSEIFSGTLQSLGEQSIKFSEAELQELPNILIKYAKKGVKGAGAVLFGGAILLGLGLGAIGDGIANCIKRKNANKAAEAAKA